MYRAQHCIEDSSSTSNHSEQSDLELKSSPYSLTQTGHGLRARGHELRPGDGAHRVGAGPGGGAAAGGGQGRCKTTFALVVTSCHFLFL